jgi:hypothetical protein
MSDRHGGKWLSDLPELFIFGVLGFPLSRSVRFCWFSLSLGGMLPIYLLLAATSRSQTAEITSATGVGPSALAMATWGMSAIFGGIWLSMAFTYCLAILRDTASGNDQIENWPDAIWIDWIGEGFYVINPLVGSLAPGCFLNWFFKFTGPTYWLLLGGSFIVLFPIMLLSVLEGNFPLKILSLPVLASLIVAFPIWMVFYVETTAVWGLALLAGRRLALGSTVGTAAALSFLLVTVLVIYSRLLGRLADYCSEVMPRS